MGKTKEKDKAKKMGKTKHFINMFVLIFSIIVIVNILFLQELKEIFEELFKRNVQFKQLNSVFLLAYLNSFFDINKSYNLFKALQITLLLSIIVFTRFLSYGFLPSLKKQFKNDFFGQISFKSSKQSLHILNQRLIC